MLHSQIIKVKIHTDIYVYSGNIYQIPQYNVGVEERLFLPASEDGFDDYPDLETLNRQGLIDKLQYQVMQILNVLEGVLGPSDTTGDTTSDTSALHIIFHPQHRKTQKLSAKEVP